MSIQTIIEEFGLPENPKTFPVAKARVDAWMQSSDIEVLGALYAFLTNENLTRVTPPLTQLEMWNFCERYLERCLREDPKGQWAHSRYAAAWDIASLIGKLWANRAADRSALLRSRDWLARVYGDSESSVKEAIVNGTMEHLFENRNIKSLFEAWRDDPVLGEAYERAAEWSEKGGATDLVPPG